MRTATTEYRLGDEIAYAMPSGMHYGTVVKKLGDGDSAAVEIEYEDGRKEVKKVRDQSLSLLRRATGQSEEQERHSGRQQLRDFEVEALRKSEQRRRS